MRSDTPAFQLFFTQSSNALHALHCRAPSFIQPFSPTLSATYARAHVHYRVSALLRSRILALLRDAPTLLRSSHHAPHYSRVHFYFRASTLLHLAVRYCLPCRPVSHEWSSLQSRRAFALLRSCSLECLCSPDLVISCSGGHKFIGSRASAPPFFEGEKFCFSGRDKLFCCLLFNSAVNYISFINRRMFYYELEYPLIINSSSPVLLRILFVSCGIKILFITDSVWWISERCLNLSG